MVKSFFLFIIIFFSNIDKPLKHDCFYWFLSIFQIISFSYWVLTLLLERQNDLLSHIQYFYWFVDRVDVPWLKQAQNLLIVPFTACRISLILQQYRPGFKDELRKTRVVVWEYQSKYRPGWTSFRWVTIWKIRNGK